MVGAKRSKEDRMAQVTTKEMKGSLRSYATCTSPRRFPMLGALVPGLKAFRPGRRLKHPCMTWHGPTWKEIKWSWNLTVACGYNRWLTILETNVNRSDHIHFTLPWIVKYVQHWSSRFRFGYLILGERDQLMEWRLYQKSSLPFGAKRPPRYTKGCWAVEHAMKVVCRVVCVQNIRWKCGMRKQLV